MSFKDAMANILAYWRKGRILLGMLEVLSGTLSLMPSFHLYVIVIICSKKYGMKKCHMKFGLSPYPTLFLWFATRIQAATFCSKIASTFQVSKQRESEMCFHRKTSLLQVWRSWLSTITTKSVVFIKSCY